MSDVNMVAEYGKLNFKLRKLKQLDQQRIKLIQQISMETSDMEFGDNGRFIFDLPTTLSSTPSTSALSYETKVSSEAYVKEGNDEATLIEDEELMETLNDLESMAIYLEKGIKELFESGRISSQQFLELANAIPEEQLLSDYLFAEGSQSTLTIQEGNEEGKDDYKYNDVISKEIHSSNIQNMLCQWEDSSFVDYLTDGNSQSRNHPQYNIMLAELRQKNKDILRKVVRACESLSPFEIHLT